MAEPDHALGVNILSATSSNATCLDSSAPSLLYPAPWHRPRCLLVGYRFEDDASKATWIVRFDDYKSFGVV
jgi:hypothetical protein